MTEPLSFNDVEIIEKTTPFKGYFRIDRYTLRHRTFAGGWTQPMSREIFERGHAVGVLLYDPVRDEVGLIEQFRTGAMAAGWHPWLLEIVAGIIEDGQTPKAVAIRETKEEAGVEIKEMVPLAHYLASAGGSTETFEIFCARFDATQLKGTHGLAEEGEDIRTLVVAADEAIAAVSSGRISNASTIISLQWLALNRADLRHKWGSGQ